jgi:hypothetical protein
MNRILLIVSAVLLLAAGIWFVTKPAQKQSSSKARIQKKLSISWNEREHEQKSSRRRWEYEWKLLHDPKTGKIPRDIRRKETLLLNRIIARQNNSNRTTLNNVYTAAGPSQRGGRTRALAFDMRTNQVIIAAGVSGGIYRSADGGANWTFVHPTGINRTVSCIAQDPRPGNQNTWYAGTGELNGASQGYPDFIYPGNGILKSTDNGATWSLLTSTSNGLPEEIDNIFDFVFNIQVDANGHVYAAILNYIVRSTDGGATWFSVLRESTLSQSVFNMVTDISISRTGSRYLASFSGRNTDRDTAGVWTSTNGVNWTRIAGASVGNSGHVPGWASYDNTVSGGAYTGGWGRTVMAIAPSNPNIAYVMYDNAFTAFDDNVPEADLFRVDFTSGTPTWSSNRTASLAGDQIDGPDVFETYMETQEEYNMLLAVHPTNPEIVLAGGVNLYRSTNGFASKGTLIGGDFSDSYTDPNAYSHVDFHSFTFDPSNPNRLIVGNDGGLQVTTNITSSSVVWNRISNKYQTLQYYHIAVDPLSGSLIFAGGAQDNSTTYRDVKGLLSNIGFPAPTDSDDHYELVGGDGGSVGLSASTATSQYLYASVQEGDVYRIFLSGANSNLQGPISPALSPGSEFITYFHLDPVNTSTLYYAGFNTLWRTTSATTVSSSNWTELTGVSSTVGTASIFALATTWGTYSTTNSYLFIGTSDGKILRLQNPRSGAAANVPVNISPLSGMTSESVVREIAVNPRNADTVLAVVSNYGVASAFWSGNATSSFPTWQLVEGNIADASFRSCAIAVTTSGVDYYVGTSIGLFSARTMNGSGTVWTLEGSPVMRGAIINDLVLRPSDNLLAVGTHGNGLFYTFIPAVPTSVNNYVLNDKQFITTVYPTVASDVLRYQTGSLTGIRSVNVRITNLSGQTVLQQTAGYQPGQLNIGQLPAGNYILEIISDNRKYKHLQKFVKGKP